MYTVEINIVAEGGFTYQTQFLTPDEDYHDGGAYLRFDTLEAAQECVKTLFAEVSNSITSRTHQHYVNKVKFASIFVPYLLDIYKQDVSFDLTDTNFEFSVELKSHVESNQLGVRSINLNNIGELDWSKAEILVRQATPKSYVNKFGGDPIG